MSRYIDADALIESIKNTADLGGWIGEALYQIKQVAIKYIGSAPSIDIVRCKECGHWEMRNSPRGWCVVHQGYVSPQYFCADGERRTDG